MLPTFPAQHGSITLVAYDYDLATPSCDGASPPLKVVGTLATTVERMQRAFNDVTLKEPNV